jgi:chemotaxis regulatin CheY-phosphate phosphatase CheZ
MANNNNLNNSSNKPVFSKLKDVDNAISNFGNDLMKDYQDNSSIANSSEVKEYLKKENEANIKIINELNRTFGEADAQILLGTVSKEDINVIDKIKKQQELKNYFENPSIFTVNYNDGFLNPFSEESSVININMDGGVIADIMTSAAEGNTIEFNHIKSTVINQLVGSVLNSTFMQVNGLIQPVMPSRLIEIASLAQDTVLFILNDTVQTVLTYISKKTIKYMSPEFVSSLAADVATRTLKVTEENLKTPDEILKELQELAQKRAETQTDEDSKNKLDALITGIGAKLAEIKKKVNDWAASLPIDKIKEVMFWIQNGPEIFLSEITRFYFMGMKKLISIANEGILWIEQKINEYINVAANWTGKKIACLTNELQRQALDKGIKLTMTNQAKIIIAGKALINKSMMQVMGLIGG